MAQKKRRKRLRNLEGYEIDEKTANYNIELSIRAKISNCRASDKKYERVGGELITVEQVKELILKEGHACKYCGIVLKYLNYSRYDSDMWSIDRKISGNHSHYYENISITCLRCNIKKGLKLDTEYIKYLENKK
jgi:5-methylcytosine-specific restriction endonuclease McrA